MKGCGVEKTAGSCCLALSPILPLIVLCRERTIMQTLNPGFRGGILRGPPGQLNKKLLELISSYSKDAAYRVNIEKSIAIALLIPAMSNWKLIKNIPSMFTFLPTNGILRYKSNKIYKRSSRKPTNF